MNQDQNQSLIKDWRFEWPILDVLLGGKSSIDLPKLAIENEDEAKQFLHTYGFDVEKKQDQKKLHSIYIEALHFIESVLMPKEWKKGKRPPEDFFTEQKVHKLLYWASSIHENRSLHQLWSCAILRVMHTIVHIDEVDRFSTIKSAEDQILKRFEPAVFREKADDSLWFGNKKNKVQIIKFEWKPPKKRDSMILKLLHKPANVSENIYDLLGLRIIVENAPDALRVLNLLLQLDLISFPNANPSRVRNTLVEVDRFKAYTDTLVQLLSNNYVNKEHFNQMIQKFDKDQNDLETENPHTQKGFKSIQLTCRQRIQIEDPGSLWAMKLMDLFEEETPLTSKCQNVIKKIIEQYSFHTKTTQKENAIYFPFEIQIIDSKTADFIKHGPASHDRYKKSQLRTARRRILHEVLKFS